MDIVYRDGRVSVAEVQAALDDAPTYSTVRALMGTLVEKGHLAAARDGRRYLYAPTVPAHEARDSALKRLVTTFFAGSPLDAALALVSAARSDADPERNTLDPDELRRLEEAIARARDAGR